MIRELVVVDAPCLQRLLTFPPHGPTSIKVVTSCGGGALLPKLEVLGYVSNTIARFEIGSMVLIKVSLRLSY